MSLEVISMILQFLSLITSFAAAAAIIIKPIREKLFDTQRTQEGQRCMLRAEMLSIYYRGQDAGGKLRQYDYQNFVLLYAAYKALDGNSFIDTINEKVKNMEVIQ
jgi:hypothetical protein